MWSQWPWPIRMWSAFFTCWPISASSSGSVAFGLNLPVRNPESKRLNHGSKRIVLLPKLISQPSVPNHLKLTPAEPGPPLWPGDSAPSTKPGSRSDLPQSVADAASPAVSPAPRKRRCDTLSDKTEAYAGSKKHIGTFSFRRQGLTACGENRFSDRSPGPPVAGAAPHPAQRMINSFVTMYRDSEREGRAHAHLARDPDPSAVELDELPREGQSEPRPFDLLLGRPHLAEFFEDRLLILRGDSHPRIGHGDFGHAVDNPSEHLDPATLR